MDFPVWQLFSDFCSTLNTSGADSASFLSQAGGGISGSMLIAAISVIHIFVAQFAVAGGFFLAAAEWKAYKSGSRTLLAEVYRYSSFFLLLSMVFGALTGVGVWLVIAVISPAGTSFLVRTFVFAWAAEWLFFLGEIIALILYSISIKRCLEGRMPIKAHIGLGIWYGIFGFLSLVVINGILTFMLTPGQWVTSHNFWDAFLNLGFLPATVFRTGLCLSLAGMFGLLMATRIKENILRLSMTRFCSVWICAPIILMFAGGIWYFQILGPEIQDSILRRTADIHPYARMLPVICAVVFAFGLIFFISLPHKASRVLVCLVLLCGLMLVAATEWAREGGRRPWLIYGYMYSNGITIQDGKMLKSHGVLATSGWARLRTFGRVEAGSVPVESSTSNIFSGRSFAEQAYVKGLSLPESLRLGQFIFSSQCSPCHGINGPMLDILPLIADRGPLGIRSLIEGQGIVTPYMPPFFGLEADKIALAEWLDLLRRTYTSSSTNRANKH